MIRKEWPDIKRDLDARTLSPVSLVKAKSVNPADLGKNHQVLAYGYDLNGTALTIHLYDPNHADDDAITMSLDIGHPDKATPVHYSDGGTVLLLLPQRLQRPAAPPRSRGPDQRSPGSTPR